MHKTMFHVLFKLPAVQSSQFSISLFPKLAHICERPALKCVWIPVVVAITPKNQTDLPPGIAATLNAEFGNRQLHRRGDFSPSLLA